MNKLTLHTPDKTNKNIAAIAALFPNTLTEVVRDGKTTHAIDFDMLRQELSSVLVEGAEERYTFNWPDKRQSVLLANMPNFKTLRPCREESEGFDTTENLYIEGDNIEVLKLLQETYLGKVKMIYIDPPYNTGKDAFVYGDDFSENIAEYNEESGDFDENGYRLYQNLSSNGRFHTDWLNMIYPRLKIAKDLLCDDGVIFISIDDNEVHNLRKVCDEVFGPWNFVCQFVWNCATAGGIRPKYTSKTHEYILVYAKNIRVLPQFDAPLSNDAIKQYNKKDSTGIYREKDFVFRNNSQNENQKYYIKCPNGDLVRPKTGYIYRFIKATFEDALKKDMVVFKETKTGPLVDESGKQANWNIYIKKYLGDGSGCPASLLPKDLISIYNVATQTIQNIFEGDRVFETAKPIDLIIYLLKIITSDNDIILDFFSGSATTAHAAMQLNAEDGGSRKFIMVQIPEVCDEKSEAFKAGYKNICEIGKERIRRAGKKILQTVVSGHGRGDGTGYGMGIDSLEEYQKATGETELDIGFRVLKIDSTNMKDVYYEPEEFTQGTLAGLVDNIKDDRTPEDLLFQVMLDLGVLLSCKIEKEVVGGKNIFTVYNGGECYLIACFDTGVTAEAITEIAKRKPYYAVFRDSGISSDSLMTSFEQIFETYSKSTVRKVL